MRTLWILFSALIAVAVTALYVGSPVDPLQRLADLIFGAGTLHLPAAGPVTRFADAALAGAIVAYLLIFVPLSIGTWLDGGRQLGLFRRALAGSEAGGLGAFAAIPVGTSSAWWPLLSLFSADPPERLDLPAGGAANGKGGGEVSRTGRTAVIDNLVANQSAAPVFRDFPVIAIGLGLIALIGQLLPVLAADPDAIVAGSNSALLGSATARGFCSLVAATATAASFGLLSQLTGAILRRRAETIFAAAGLAVRQAHWSAIGDDAAAEERRGLLVTPLPNGAPGQPAARDDKLIEHVAAQVAAMPDLAGRQMAESVETALRDIQNTTLRPMLHDISRLLSLLGDRASQLVDTVDERLRQHTEHTRQILEATSRITETLDALAERQAALGDGTSAPADGGLMPLSELRQAMNDERAAAAEVLRGIGQGLTGELDRALRTTARAVMKPATSQTEAIRKAAERIDATTAAMERVGTLIETSSRTIEQKLDRLVTAQESATGHAAAGDDAGTASALRGAAQEVVAIAGSARTALDAIAALSSRLDQEGARRAAAAEPGGWAQRIRALHRDSVELTSTLPPLATNAFNGMPVPDGAPADALAREREELAALEAEVRALNEARDDESAG